MLGIKIFGESTSQSLDVTAIKGWDNENQIYERKSTNKEHKSAMPLELRLLLHRDFLHRACHV